MALIANRRSVMTLFSDAVDPQSHRVRVVLAEKGITVEVLNIDPDNKPEDLIDLNPYQSVPTLVDRELVLYDPRVMTGAEFSSITGIVEQYTKLTDGWDYYQLNTRAAGDIVPEPATLCLLGAGLAVVARRRRRGHPRRRRRRVGPLLAAGGPDRQDGQAGRLSRLWHLRGDATHRWDEGLLGDHRHQQGQ